MSVLSLSLSLYTVSYYLPARRVQYSPKFLIYARKPSMKLALLYPLFPPLPLPLPLAKPVCKITPRNRRRDRNQLIAVRRFRQTSAKHWVRQSVLDIAP